MSWDFLTSLLTGSGTRVTVNASEPLVTKILVTTQQEKPFLSLVVYSRTVYYETLEHFEYFYLDFYFLTFKQERREIEKINKNSYVGWKGNQVEVLLDLGNVWVRVEIHVSV